MSSLPKGPRCPIGPLQAHTYNHEDTECIWCGPSGLAWKPGRWVPNDDGSSAWSVKEPATCSRESCDRPVDPAIDPDLCPGHRHQAENVPSAGRL